MKLLSFILFSILSTKNLLNKKKNFFNLCFLSHTFYQRHKNKNFIICLPGKSLTKYVNEINNIKNNQYLIITCNKANSIVNSDYHLFTNRKRLLTSEIKNGKYLISPQTCNKIIKSKLKFQIYEYIPVININSRVLKSFLFIFKDFIFTNNASSAISAVCLAILMGASKITIYGMDGYKDSNNHFYDEKDTKNFSQLIMREKINLKQIEILKEISTLKNIKLEIVK